jgi:hypothetical protein
MFREPGVDFGELRRMAEVLVVVASQFRDLDRPSSIFVRLPQGLCQDETCLGNLGGR